MNLPTGVTKIEGFVADPEALFERLMAETVWDESMTARKTASFGVPYNFTHINYPAVELPSALEVMSEDIEHELGTLFNNCLMNLYADGSGSMGFHSDDTSCLQPGTGVAIVSLGFERIFTFRRKDDSSIEVSVGLPSGSLLYMDGGVQAEWLHGIRKMDHAGPRISLTWRAFVE